MGSCLWKADTPRAVKRLAFWTKVVSAAVSGMESYTCSEKGCASLDKIIIKYLRDIMKGKAYANGGEGSHGGSLTNVQVLQTWQVCPMD